MKTTLLLLSVFLSASLFGQNLQVPKSFNLNKTSNYLTYELSSHGTKKDAISEVFKILKLNKIDSLEVQVEWNLNTPIFHQENVIKRKKMWLFLLSGHWDPKSIGKYKIFIFELSNTELVNFGTTRLPDGTNRTYYSKPY